MGYLIGQILGCLSLAAVTGFIAGWVARGAASRGNELRAASGPHTPPSASGAPDPSETAAKATRPRRTTRLRGRRTRKTTEAHKPAAESEELDGEGGSLPSSDTE